MTKILLALMMLLAPSVPIPGDWGVTVLSNDGVAFAATATNIATGVVIAVDPAAALANVGTGTKEQNMVSNVFDAVIDGYTTITTKKGDNEIAIDWIRRHNEAAEKLLDENKARALAKGIDYKLAKANYDSTH